MVCSKCQSPIPREFFNLPGLHPCPACASPLHVQVFPALFKSPAPADEGDTPLGVGESTCFYHPAKKAVIPCESCGRFLCSLCDISLNGTHLCPACVEAGKRKRQLKLDRGCIRYDNMALALALLPILTVWGTIFAAPLAIYIAIRYWNAPLGIVPRSRVKFVLAIILATLQIAGWALLIYYFTQI